ncbi:MAG: hypothetical protein M3046_03710, partial [Actinomycetota bacterium]|nr:hypothetical protein [Actinomycetota bacterium]
MVHGTPTRGVATYDAARKLIVLVTPGPTQQATLLQTWTWDGTVWTRRDPALSPPARAESLLAYDPSRRVALLQGGLSRDSLTDTWEWDGITWSQRKPVHPPAASEQPGSMAY